MLFYRNCLGFQDFSTQQRENSIFSSNSNQEIIPKKKKEEEGITAEKLFTTPQLGKYKQDRDRKSLSSNQIKAISV